MNFLKNHLLTYFSSIWLKNSEFVKFRKNIFLIETIYFVTHFAAP